jgi:hypothetical protein
MALLAVAISCYAVFAVYIAWQGMHCNDFKHMYLGMKALLDGDEPYSPQSLFHQAALNGMGGVSLNPYVYLPFTGLALAFLSPFSFPVAATVWFVINHVSAVAACWIIADALFWQARLRAFAVLLLGLALSHPMVRTLTAGQLNLILFLCLAGAFWLLQRRYERTAGAVLGFAACFKLAPALFLLYFALRRRWHALASMAATILLLMLLSIASFGWKVHAEFLPVLGQMSYGHSTWEQLRHPPTFWKDPTNQSLNSLFTHLMVGDEAIRPWISSTQARANAATMLVTALLVVLYIGFNLRRPPSGSAGFPFTALDAASYNATVVLALLIPSLMWDHYLVLLLLPTAWLVSALHPLRRWTVMALTVGCYGISLLPWHFDANAFRHGPGLLLMSIKLFPTIALLLLTFAVLPRAAAD